jgi:hypothetical protein
LLRSRNSALRRWRVHRGRTRLQDRGARISKSAAGLSAGVVWHGRSTCSEVHSPFIVGMDAGGEVSKRCGRTTLLRSRDSALRSWREDRGGMGDCEARISKSAAGMGARDVRHGHPACSEVSGPFISLMEVAKTFRAAAPKRLAEESELRASALPRSPNPHALAGSWGAARSPS